MRLVWLISLLLVVALCGYQSLLRPAHAGPSQAAPVMIDTGGTMQVTGAPLGCRVIVPSGVKTLDCRLAGPLAGSYGILMSSRRVQVVRFRSAHVAKVVFVATQRGGFRTCR
jgi:hypothetical protein